ncbi:MAG: UvrD-helicase domain-containing protein [Ferruginibacter sp.]|nr:UvrD-helicase domain-containing protein [Ferruginibacter sp.]
MRNYLTELNEQQREAVQHTDGPLMIIAGAGSGKTKVLTTRIAYLMAEKKVDPFNILALTFTNKAAAEMKERISKILGNTESRNLYIGTFHSVFARILRAEASKLGYPPNFTIYDTDDAKSVIKAIVKEMNLDEKQYKPNAVYNRISSAKNSLILPDQYLDDALLKQEDTRANRPLLGIIFKNYATRCFKNGAMDFDDLLLNMYILLTTFPEALSKYQHKFKYILIDEYQDTNPAQYEIIKLLGALHENVCVVGDDAQSIYSFRGATIQNIMQFQHDYEDVHLIKLEQNYRSTKKILQVANEVISNNIGQIEKKLFTHNDDGEKIQLIRTLTDNDEGRMVADTIKELKLRNHFYNHDFAILYRTNAQSRSFEESLRKMGIPYRIYGGMSFYQHKEIKDFIAYLRVVINPNDEEALKRIINYPARGIGKTTQERAILAANNHNTTFWDILSNAARYGFKGNTLDGINDFVTMIKMFQSELPKKNAYDLAFIVGKNSGIVKELFNDKSTEGLNRYENIQELLNAIKEFTETPMNEEDGEVGEKDLGSYLQQISLLTDADDDKSNTEVVKLMTIHAAKGLEFPVVFVGGLEETLFPNAMSIHTRDDLEEERRLFYVAITRAQKYLLLSYSNARYRFGQLQQNDPSRFLEEIPEAYIERKNITRQTHLPSSGWGAGSAYERMHRGFSKQDSSFSKQPLASTIVPKPKIKEHVPSDNFQPSNLTGLTIGQKVEHLKFGYGTVSNMEGAAHNPIATILFEQNGEKKIMLNYAKLRIVE